MARKKAAEGEEQSLERAIRMAVDTGTVEFGARVSHKRSLAGNSKLFVISADCPKYSKMGIEKFASLSGVEVLQFAGTSIELGALCGRPYPVSVLSVREEGNSKLLTFTKKGA